MQQLNTERAENGAYSTLYDRFAVTIFQNLCEQVSHKQDAEDLLLEVFVAALQNESLSSLPAGRQLAWLRRVARNKVIDRYRHVALLNLLPIEQCAFTKLRLSSRNPRERCANCLCVPCASCVRSMIS